MQTTEQGPRLRSCRARSGWAWLAGCALAVAACGSQLSDQALLAQARGQANAAGASASGSVGGTPGQDQPASSGETVPAPVGSAPGAGIATSTGAGNAGTGATTNQGGVSAAAPQGCTGKEPMLTIGSVGEQSGVVGSFLADGPRAVAAWAAAVNARGGVACHKVHYVIEDDGGDPSRHQSQVRDLVESKGVMAFVHMDATIAGEASVPYLNQHQIPVVGTEGGSPWVYKSPIYFPQMGSGDLALAAGVAALSDYGKAHGKTKLATMSCIEASICSGLNDIAPALARRFGLELVYRGQVSLAQPDFTSNCQAAQGAGAQLMLVGLDPNSLQRLLRSCASVNFAPQFATGGPIPTPSLPADPRTNGVLVAVTFVPFTVTGNPIVRDYLDTLAHYAPGTPPSFSGMAGFLSAKLFELGVTGVKGDVTSASLLASLDNLRNNDLSGSTYPMTFRAGQPAAQVLCYWTAQIRDGKYQSLNGSPRVCP